MGTSYVDATVERAGCSGVDTRPFGQRRPAFDGGVRTVRAVSRR
jgi:hypothetical protein